LIDEGSQGGRRSRLVPGLVTAAGAGLLIAGGVLIATDQDPSTDGPHLIRNTERLGVGLAIPGVIATGIGLYLLFRPSSDGAPVAAASSSGAYVGWIQRF
jgi:hypothetical protein